jgi:dephospho-CoA kinase
MVFTVRKVAITGSIASGKSTVRRFLQDLGAYTVDADPILHQACTLDSQLGQQIVALLGKEIVERGIIQRATIAKIVMNEPSLLDQLEDICHPYVNATILDQYDAAEKRGQGRLFVVEMPLLFESRFSMRDWFDSIVLVIADRVKAKDRLRNKSSSMGQEQLTFLEERQLPQDDKLKKADIVIENNSDLQTVKRKVKVLYDLLCTHVGCRRVQPYVIGEPSL